MSEKPESFVNMNNARLPEQAEVMSTIQDQGHCPFCPDNLHKYHKQPILTQGDNWVITPNQWPYEDTRQHILAITKYHAETLSDLRDGAFDELQEHLVWAEKEFFARFGAIAMRFGDVTSNGASVRHLHAHFIVPDEQKDPQDKVRFKIG